VKPLWDTKRIIDAGIAGSPMTIKRLVDSGRLAPGRRVTPNRRVWTDEEIAALLASSPVERKPDWAARKK